MIHLPQLGIGPLRAKIDTGARSSSLHVEKQWRYVEQGAPWVGFLLREQRHLPDTVEAALPILEERMVSDSGGHRTLRPFVSTQIVVGGQPRVIELNLADRRGMLFSLLLGRRALEGFLVNPHASFLHGKP
jgi:hypothetical protein